MKKLYILSVAIIAAFSTVTLSGCGSGTTCKTGSGKLVTQTRKAGNFTKIDIEGGFKVVLKQDTGSVLSITGDDNLMDDIKSEVNGDQLKVESKNLCPSGSLTLNISLKDLTAISASGAIDLTSAGKITAKDVTLDLSGATKVTLDLNADNLTTKGSGLTELNLTGQASSHTIDLAGAGHLNALNFIVAKYKLTSSGAVTFKINVLNQLDVDSNGASDVQYKGNPASVNTGHSGASSVKKIE